MSHDDRIQDPGHGEPDHVHDESWNGAAEYGMTVGGLPPAVTGGEAGATGEAEGPDERDHADQETKQETGTAGDPSQRSREPSGR